MYVVAINNLTNRPINFLVSNVWVAQVSGGQVAKQLKVYRYEELVTEERNRQIASAVVTGLAAAANSASATNAGYYNANATVSGPRGTSNVTITGYDPTAAQIAQARTAAENEAMIAGTIETGRRNLAILEKAVIKDNTMMPGEWYGGQLQFEAPRDDGGKNMILNIQVGADLHQIEVSHDPT